MEGKGKKMFIVLGGVILIVLLIINGILFYLNGKKVDKPEEKRNIVVNHDNAEEIAGAMLEQEYIEPGYYSVSMSTTWNFETGDAISADAYVVNLEENTNDVYFDVFLADDETEPILQSPVIPRGSELDNISLDKPLEAGTYECVMVYHLIDEEQNTLSTLRIAFTVVVEK